MSDDLTEIIDDMLRIQKDMSARLIEHRGHIVSVEFAVLAISEQLVANGHLDAQIAARRLLEMSRDIEPDRFREMVLPQLDALAKRLRELQSARGLGRHGGFGPTTVN